MTFLAHSKMVTVAAFAANPVAYRVEPVLPFDGTLENGITRHCSLYPTQPDSISKLL